MPYDIVTSMVECTKPEGRVPAYYCHPSSGRHPGVVVIQEWWGLDDHIKEVTERIAREGYLAIAPDLYYGTATTEPDEARKLSMELDRARAAQDIDAAVNYLQFKVNFRGKVGIVGYCMGGSLAFTKACQRRDLGVAVIYYGNAPDPLDPLQSIACPVLGHFGAEDQGIPAARVEAIRQALNQHGIRNEIHVYPGAPHAFFNDTRPSYRAEAAAQSWERTLGFFQQNLRPLFG